MTAGTEGSASPAPPAPISPTRVLCKVAAMAAGGLPAIDRFSIFAATSFDIGLPTIAQAREWATAFEITTDVREFNSDRNPVRIYSASRGGWHGWSVTIRAADPIGATSEQIPTDDPDMATVLACAEDPR